jgi:hypothetical protein
VEIYDSHNTEITASQAAVLEGRLVPSEGLWIIPIAGAVQAMMANLNIETIVSRVSLIELLVEKQPPIDHILSVYELNTRLELVRYYHATTGFPTQPTWIKTINNVHYQSWLGLTAALATRHFPESNKTWRDHGWKIQANLRSTKKSIEEEVAETKADKENILQELGV